MCHMYARLCSLLSLAWHGYEFSPQRYIVIDTDLYSHNIYLWYVVWMNDILPFAPDVNLNCTDNYDVAKIKVKSVTDPGYLLN